MSKLHLIATENKVFKNKISCLLYKELFIDENHKNDWEEVEVSTELFNSIFKE